MITLVFSGFRLILHLAHHIAKFRRSCCKSFAAKRTFKLKAHCAVSSANWDSVFEALKIHVFKMGEPIHYIIIYCMFCFLYRKFVFVWVSIVLIRRTINQGSQLLYKVSRYNYALITYCLRI